MFQNIVIPRNQFECEMCEATAEAAAVATTIATATENNRLIIAVIVIIVIIINPSIHKVSALGANCYLFSHT